MCVMIIRHRRRRVSGKVLDTLLPFAHVCLMRYRRAGLRRRVSDEVQLCVFADMCLMMQCPFLDGYCSTVQGLLDWFEVDLGFPELFLFRLICVLSVFFADVCLMTQCQHHFDVQPLSWASASSYFPRAAMACATFSLPWSELQCVAVCRVAVCCSVLQCVAVCQCCSVLQRWHVRTSVCDELCCSLSQSVAVCCSLL